MIKKIDHIGIAVADLQSAVEKYEKFTEQPCAHQEHVATQKVDTAFFPVGEVRLELLKGTTADSPISKFIVSRGEGVHHICFEVDNLDQAKSAFENAGMRFIENISSEGAEGSKVAFIHPNTTGGILFELVEYPKSTP